MADLPDTTNAPAEASRYWTTPEGETVKIPLENVADMAGMDGYAPADPTAIHHYEVRQGVRGPLSGLVAFGEGAGRAVAPGAFTWLEKEGGVDPEEIKAREEEWPVAGALGTGAGIIIPAALTGGGSVVEEGVAKAGTEAAIEGAAHLAPEALEGAGKLAGGAGEVIPKLSGMGIPEPLVGAAPEIAAVRSGRTAEALAADAGESIHPADMLFPNLASQTGQTVKDAIGQGSFAAKLAGNVAGNAVEGAAYGLGAAVDEKLLGDPRDVADLLWADGGMGAVFGAGLGLVVPVGEAALQKAYATVKRPLAAAMSGIESAGKRLGDSTAEILWSDRPAVANIISELEPGIPDIKARMAAMKPDAARWVVDHEALITDINAHNPRLADAILRLNPDVADAVTQDGIWKELWLDSNPEAKAASVKTITNGLQDYVDAVKLVAAQAPETSRMSTGSYMEKLWYDLAEVRDAAAGMPDSPHDPALMGRATDIIRNAVGMAQEHAATNAGVPLKDLYHRAAVTEHMALFTRETSADDLGKFLGDLRDVLPARDRLAEHGEVFRANTRGFIKAAADNTDQDLINTYARRVLDSGRAFSDEIKLMPIRYPEAPWSRELADKWDAQAGNRLNEAVDAIRGHGGIRVGEIHLPNEPYHTAEKGWNIPQDDSLDVIDQGVQALPLTPEYDRMRSEWRNLSDSRAQALDGHGANQRWVEHHEKLLKDKDFLGVFGYAEDGKVVIDPAKVRRFLDEMGTTEKGYQAAEILKKELDSAGDLGKLYSHRPLHEDPTVMRRTQKRIMSDAEFYANLSPTQWSEGIAKPNFLHAEGLESLRSSVVSVNAQRKMAEAGADVQRAADVSNATQAARKGLGEVAQAEARHIKLPEPIKPGKWDFLTGELGKTGLGIAGIEAARSVIGSMGGHLPLGMLARAAEAAFGAKAVVNTLKDAPSFIAALAAMENTGKKIDTFIRQAAGRLVGSPTVSRVGDVGRGLALAGTTRYWTMDDDAADTKAKKIVASVQDMARDPSLAAARMQAANGDLAGIAPNIAFRLGGVGTSVILNVYRHRPRQSLSGDPTMAALPVSREANDFFVQYAEGALDPVGALEKAIESGMLTDNTLAGISDSHGPLMQRVAQHLVTELADARRLGKTVNQDMIPVINKMLGMPVLPSIFATTPPQPPKAGTMKAIKTPTMSSTSGTIEGGHAARRH